MLSCMEHRRSTNPLLGVAAAVVAVVIVIALVAGRDRRQQFAEGSPQAVVQSYLDAVFDGDPDLALTMLDSTTAARCKSPLRRSIAPSEVRAVLVSDRVDGDSATIELRLDFLDSGPFGGDGYSTQERFFLERTDDQWQISEDPWPAAPCTF